MIIYVYVRTGEGLRPTLRALKILALSELSAFAAAKPALQARQLTVLTAYVRTCETVAESLLATYEHPMRPFKEREAAFKAGPMAQTAAELHELGAALGPVGARKKNQAWLALKAHSKLQHAELRRMGSEQEEALRSLGITTERLDTLWMRFNLLVTKAIVLLYEYAVLATSDGGRGGDRRARLMALAVRLAGKPAAIVPADAYIRMLLTAEGAEGAAALWQQQERDELVRTQQASEAANALEARLTMLMQFTESSFLEVSMGVEFLWRPFCGVLASAASVSDPAEWWAQQHAAGSEETSYDDGKRQWPAFYESTCSAETAAIVQSMTLVGHEAHALLPAVAAALRETLVAWQ